MPSIPDRCRIVLVAPPGADPATLPRRIAEALSGGDVASLILPQYAMDEAAWQKLAERIVPHAQQAGVAVILAGLFPILWTGGAGAEVMRRIAAPLVGGMLTAPLLSLFVIPAAYLMIRRRGIERLTLTPSQDRIATQKGT